MKTESQCCEWKGTKTSKGYGVLDIGGRQFRAHRIALQLHLGRSLPRDKVIDHLCRNRACINPLHMELVTNAENVMRGESFAVKNKSKTHCLRGHEYDRTYPARKGNPTHLWRKCSTCSRDKKRYYKSLKQHGK